MQSFTLNMEKELLQVHLQKNDTPLGEYKEQGKTIFMNAFKEAYEATGNEYY